MKVRIKDQQGITIVKECDDYFAGLDRELKLYGKVGEEERGLIAIYYDIMSFELVEDDVKPDSIPEFPPSDAGELLEMYD